MVEDLEVQKIKAIWALLSERLSGTTEESAYFTFVKLEENPLLKNRLGLKKILDIISTGSRGRISWDYKKEPRASLHAMSAADVDARPTVHLEKVGIEIHVSDPQKIGKYFQEILLSLGERSSNSPINLSSKESDGSVVATEGEVVSTDALRIRLLKEKNEEGIEIGYLQFSPRGHKIRIGEADSRKFRLLLCLFNPDAPADLSFKPTPQRYDRVFENIRLQKDMHNGKLNVLFPRDAKLHIIKETIKEIRRGNLELQRRLIFIFDKEFISIKIDP